MIFKKLWTPFVMVFFVILFLVSCQSDGGTNLRSTDSGVEIVFDSTPPSNPYPEPSSDGGYPAAENQNGFLEGDTVLSIMDSTSILPGDLLYHSDQNGTFQIFNRSADGTVTSLTADLSYGVEGQWSPAGTEIAFVTSGVDQSNLIIYLMDSDGSNKRPITANQPRLNWRPIWSPDGTALLFLSNRDGNQEIYKINRDGTELTNLTNNSANDLDPDWSPINNKIVFVSSRSGGNGIFTMAPDGSNVQEVIGPEWKTFFPKWSPDGSQIAFASQYDGTVDIYTMNADGSNIQKVTSRDGDNSTPFWVDNSTILYSGEVGDFTWDLYLLDLESLVSTQLTGQRRGESYSEKYPVWRP